MGVRITGIQLCILLIASRKVCVYNKYKMENSGFEYIGKTGILTRSLYYFQLILRSRIKVCHIKMIAFLFKKYRALNILLIFP